MFELFWQHQFWITVALYWIYSAAVGSLPFPADNGSPLYLWLYRFSHTIAGNIKTAFGNRIPALALMILLVVSASGCMAHYTVHPGSMDTLDSTTYDALQIAQAVIDQARTDAKAGQLPDAAKTALNALIQSYNIARESWLIYRGALTTNATPNDYREQLTKNIADLTNAVRTLKEAQ